MNAACALGLCVAGLRGQLRKLPFGVSACYAGLAPPVVHLGWVACSGDVFPDLSSEFEDPPLALSTAVFVSDAVSTLPPVVVISHAVAAIIDVLPVPGGSSTAGKPYGGRDSARSNPSVCRRPWPSASSWRSWEPGGVCTLAPPP